MYAAAGIAIVHGHYPFSRAYQMAETLCSAAKKALKTRGEPGSVLALRRITTSLDDEVLDATLAWRSSREGDPLDDLLQAVKVLPRGTLRTWLTAFEDGQTVQAQKLWDRAAEVVKPELWADMKAALALAGADPTTGAYLADNLQTLALGNPARSTPILDALTLARLERGSESHE